MRIPWNSPGKNTGVDSHSHLQGIFPTQGSNSGLLHCRQILYHLSHQEKQKRFDFLFCYRFSQVRPPTLDRRWGSFCQGCACVCARMLSHSVMSDSLWPHGLQPARILRKWDFPGRNIGVGCSRGSYSPSDHHKCPALAGGIFTAEPPGKSLCWAQHHSIPEFSEAP